MTDFFYCGKSKHAHAACHAAKTGSFSSVLMQVLQCIAAGILISLARGERIPSWCSTYHSTSEMSLMRQFLLVHAATSLQA
jgi:hypothetical protein